LIVGLFGCFTFAAPSKARPARTSARRGYGSHGSDFLTKALDLTKDQKAKIAKIRKDTAEKIKALVKAQNEDIEKVLTAEQTKKLADIKKKMEARREEMKKKFEERRKPHDKKAESRKGKEKVYVPCQKSKLDENALKEGDVLEIS